MSKFKTLLLTIAMVPFVTNAQNLVRNGDTESNLENWEPIQVQISTENQHAGNSCLKTEGTHIFGSAVIPIDGTNTYKYSGWFKIKDWTEFNR